MPVTYRFNNGVPNQITQKASPLEKIADLDHDMGLFAQDRWTIGSWTLGMGVRLDYFKASYPAQHVGPGALVPTRDLSFPKGPALRWVDVTPKLSIAHGLFGSGKTALKATLNKLRGGAGAAGAGRSQ